MTDIEIEKGLECCAIEEKCQECPYEDNCNFVGNLITDTIAYINRLKDRIAELEKQLAVSDRALTLEEVKALPLGEWVWIVDFFYEGVHNAYDGAMYARKYAGTNQLLDCGTWGCGFTYEYSDYGTKWIAYKNKEQAKQELEKEQISNGTTKV